MSMTLKETCPDCGTPLEMRNACCEDRAKGWLLVKACMKCNTSKRWDPQSLFGGENGRLVEDSKASG